MTKEEWMAMYDVSNDYIRNLIISMEYDFIKECKESMKNAQTISKTKPCEDAIDRQALRARFNHLDEVYEGMSEEEKREAYIYGQIIRAIDDAPPVTPKQKTGKWIDQGYKDEWWCDVGKCSACGEEHIFGLPYCPCCGVKMKGANK